MKKNKFLAGSIILIAGEILTRLLGLIYIIPLSNINDGIGAILAILTTPYSIFLMVSALGVANIVNSEISRYYGKNHDEVKATTINGMLYVTILSVIGFLIVMVFAPQMMNVMIGDEVSSVEYYDALVASFRIMGVSIIFFAINMHFKSLLIGVGHLKIVSYSYVQEAFLKILFTMAIVLFFKDKLTGENADLGYACYAIGIGVTLSVATTTILYTVHIIRTKLHRRLLKGVFKFKPQKFKYMFVTGGIFFVTGIYVTAFTLIDQIVASNLIGLSGEREEIYGAFFTDTSKLVMLAVTMGAVFTTMLIKHIESSEEKEKFKEFNNIINNIILYCSLAIAGYLIAIPYIYNLLFPPYNPTGIYFLRIQAVLIPFYILRDLIGVYAIIRGHRKNVIKTTIIMFGLKLFLTPALCFGFMMFGVKYGYLGLIVSSIISITVATIILYKMNIEIIRFSKKQIFQKLLITLFTVLALVVFLMADRLFRSFTDNNVLLFMANALLILIVFVGFYTKLFLKLERK
ncbi:MAG: MATE family efflux transporter [Mycoplasmatales bacterium]